MPPQTQKLDWKRSNLSCAPKLSAFTPRKFAALPLLQLRKISFHPNPGSQGDQKSLFLFSAAIRTFEAQDFPAAAQETVRTAVDFKVCRSTTSALHTQCALAEQTGLPPS